MPGEEVGGQGQAGADRETIDTLEKALEESPNSRGLQVQLAGAYLQASQPAKAASLLRKTNAGEKADPRRESLLLQAITLAEGQAAGRAQDRRAIEKRDGASVVAAPVIDDQPLHGVVPGGAAARSAANTEAPARTTGPDRTPEAPHE